MNGGTATAYGQRSCLLAGAAPRRDLSARRGVIILSTITLSSCTVVVSVSEYDLASIAGTWQLDGSVTEGRDPTVTVTTTHPTCNHLTRYSGKALQRNLRAHDVRDRDRDPVVTLDMEVALSRRGP